VTSGFDPFDRLVVERTPAWMPKAAMVIGRSLEEFATVPGGPHDR